MSYENGIAPITQKLKTQIYVLDFTYYSRPFRGRFYFLSWQRKRNTGYHYVPMVWRFLALYFCEYVSADEGFPTHLPLGTAYAVWTGIGAVGTALVGIFVFKEPASFWRLFFLSTLIGSVVGLKAVSS